MLMLEKLQFAAVHFLHCGHVNVDVYVYNTFAVRKLGAREVTN
jgi:hypothetical protein